METTLDRFGRIVIPKDVRKGMGLEPGSVLRIENEGQKIVIQPVPTEPQIVEKEGILVFTGVAEGDIASALHEHRQGRVKKTGQIK